MKQLIYLSLLLVFTSCTWNDFITDIPVGDKNEVSLYMMVTTPNISLPSFSTRSQESAYEDSIEEINVLILEDKGEGFIYQYMVKGRSLTYEGNKVYAFHALLSATGNPLKLYILANANLLIGNIPVGSDETLIKQQINQSFTSQGIPGTMLMFAEVLLEQGLTEEGTQVNASLVRSVARVDVINNSTNFRLESVQLFRAHNLIQVIQEETDTNPVIRPSVPSGSQRNIHTEAILTNGSNCEAQIYLPESAIVPAGDRLSKATCVVIGGKFEDDEDITYYRMDFVPDENPELFGQILRNHKYIFYIEKVLGSGWRKPDEAANNNSSQIEVIIKKWNDEIVEMVFDGYHHLGVSCRTVHLDYHAGYSSRIEVDTDLDSYFVYWLDEYGNKTSDNKIGWGQSFSSDLFTVTVSPDGAGITITTKKENISEDLNTGSILIEAGRMRIRIYIDQEVVRYGSRHIYICGLVHLSLGGLGNEVGGSTQPTERAIHLRRKIKNPKSFGPMGTVHFDGFVIAGRTGAEITLQEVNLYDVVYLPYLANPSRVSVEYYYEWVKASKNRVLFIYYDSSDTNPYFREKLGFTYVKAPFQPYFLHPDAPEEIINGPFGEISDTLWEKGIRAKDDTVGEILMSEAEKLNITPILVSNDRTGVVLGIDFKNQIVYCGDIDIFNQDTGGSERGGICITNGENITNDADKLTANLWAWIAKTVLTY